MSINISLRMNYLHRVKRLFILIYFLVAVPFPVKAQAPLLNEGLEITPFLIEAEVDKGGNYRSSINLTNRNATAVEIDAEPRDFLPGKEGQPKFVPDNENNQTTFSLASWINIEGNNRFSIAPGQTFKVSFSVNPPVDAEQGTHYGALLFNFSLASDQSNSTEVTQSLGTIILVRYGQAREGGKVDLRLSQKFYFTADKISFENVFINTGNVHVKPKGEVYIKSLLGNIVASPFVNRDAANVLPQTERTFYNSWVPSSFTFGRYTFDSVIQYGNSQLEARGKVVIWILPWPGLLALIVAAVVILWFIFHGRHWHKRRVIKRHFENQDN